MECKAHVPYKGIIPIDCGHRNKSSAERERLEADFLPYVLAQHHLQADAFGDGRTAAEGHFLSNGPPCLLDGRDRKRPMTEASYAIEHPRPPVPCIR